MRWPRGKDGTGDETSTKEHTTYRGGGLPAEHIPFYEKMMKDGLYSRVPAPLPTSFLRQTAIMFRKRAENMGHRGVIWEVKLKDPDLDDGGWQRHRRRAVLRADERLGQPLQNVRPLPRQARWQRAERRGLVGWCARSAL